MSLKRRELLSLCASLALGLAGLAGCDGGGSSSTGGSGGGDGKLTVGFSQIGAESSWRTAETNSIRSEAENRGVDLKFSDAQGKQEDQIKALDNLVIFVLRDVIDEVLELAGIERE